MSPGVPPRLKVIADPNRVQSERLGFDRESEQLVGTELLRGRLVTEFEHARFPFR